ncbi:hypothetical protein EXIGLDRAFT_730277 [Exidia glandulosa HHB12029]|uniref:DUF6535 domain-containing protein n=1 Tax=Exidia glandulosa HHB12029 TaxID=1314781 RepID=A0A165LAW6_EXIGL|nr:hypothetical protein EXIGLDRAFT_730277 [Exidia glandulosa HHB12029]
MSITNQATTATPSAQEPVKVGIRPTGADTDFKEKYPPDRELGHELDDTARVWKVYRGEAIAHDDALLKTWNETVNILLTFAGLFSAAVTSFVVASTDDLKPDPNAYVANLLFAMGNASGGNTSYFVHLPAPPPLGAAPTSLARVVNGLWFTSLFLSLAAALLCILIKQWLDEYTARTRGSAKHPLEWAQRRSFYFQGLTDWHVAVIVSFLPLFLHMALFLFLVGLTAFLWDLDSAIRWVLLLLMLLLIAVYTVSLFIPIWCAACPYATPLLAQLRNLALTALIGIHIARNLLSKVMIRHLLRRVCHYQVRPSLPTSAQNTDVDSSEGDSHMKYLLDQRFRRPFERVLRKMRTMEEAADFEARLECSALSWLVSDVSDSDAVAVAWQSLGALLEHPESRTCTHMRTILTGLVEYTGGYSALWKTSRLDGALDDLQLGRITRSALFIASSKASVLREILCDGLYDSDSLFLENTASPDAALIYSQLRPRKGVRVVHLLEEKGYRPLPSTALFLLHQLVPDAVNSATQPAIELLYYCDRWKLPTTVWNHFASILGLRCTGREANTSHECRESCVANALCASPMQLVQDKTHSTSHSRQSSVAPLNAYSRLWIVIRIVSGVDELQSVKLSADVWSVLTSTRSLSSRIRREDRISAKNWARALHKLLMSRHDTIYESFATKWNSTWSRLLRGYVPSHQTVVLDEGIDFDEGIDNVVAMLATNLDYFRPWRITMADPALRHARRRSALTLVESASIVICSTNPDMRIWSYVIALFVCEIPLFALLPTDRALTEAEHNEWVDLFVSAAQHLLVLDPRPWQTLRDAVAASTDNDVNSFFEGVHTRLTELGPCTKGDCARKAPTDSDWLSALGPRL